MATDSEEGMGWKVQEKNTTYSLMFRILLNV